VTVIRTLASLVCAAIVSWPALAPSQPLDPSDPCAAGRQLFVQNDYLAAEPLLRRCLERGESVAALLPLTMITVVQGRPEQGRDFGERALALAPDNANVRYWYGRALLETGAVDAARTQWEEALGLDSGHVGVLEALARLSLRTGEQAKAYNLLNQLQMQGVDEPWLHRMLSGLARRKGLWDQAAEHWADVVAREGESEENLLVLGELTILAGEPQKAVDIFRHAVEVVPSGATWGGLGEAWFAMEEVDSAAVALRRAVELAPDDPRNRFNLANALELLGDAEGAGKQFRAYLDARPEDPVARFNYGVHLEHQGQLEAALEQIERAVELDPQYVQAHVVLAQLYEEQGRVEDALPLLDQLARLDPDAAGELAAWRERLLTSREEAASQLAAGKVRLLHIVTSDPEAAGPLREALAAGEDFASLAARFSEGPTAVRGGDIGWVDPGGMREPLRTAIEELAPGERTALITAGERTHVFKRVR
jgi:tetratricopeptide (TPR) repeat protein